LITTFVVNDRVENVETNDKIVVFNKQSRFAWLRTSHGSVDKKGFPQLGHELFVCIVRETKKKKQ